MEVTIKTIAIPVILIYPLASILIGKVLIDQSSSRRIMSDLKKSEFTLQKIFEILPIGLWFADKNGNLLKGNRAGVDIWGAEPQVGMGEYKVFKARRIPSMEEVKDGDWALNHTINEGMTVKDELLETDSFDGKKKIILNYTAPIKNENNEILGAIVVNQDVTGYIQSEEKLRKSETLLKETQKISKIGGWEWNVERDVMYWTDEVYAIHGLIYDERENSSKKLIAQSIECYREQDRDSSKYSSACI
jgi:PAS domain S-box-containing protein